MLSRRRFVTGLLSVPVGALVAREGVAAIAALPEPKQPVVFEPVPIETGPFFIDDSSEVRTEYYGTIRERHQMLLTNWLKNKVDEAAFNTLSGRVK